MNPNHYVSLPVAQELAKAGLFKYPAFIYDVYGEGQAVWKKDGESGNWELLTPEDIREDFEFWDQLTPEEYEHGDFHRIVIPAPSLGELLDRFACPYHMHGGNYFKFHTVWREPRLETLGETAANAAALMLLELEGVNAS